MSFPSTPHTLLSQLKQDENGRIWHDSWQRFHELYHTPVTISARFAYRIKTRGLDPTPTFIEEAVSMVFVKFFKSGNNPYNKSKGRLRTYLRMITKNQVIDMIRKERNSKKRFLDETALYDLPVESNEEAHAYDQTILSILLDELRKRIPIRRYVIFERVKIKQQLPVEIAREFNITRAAVDREVHKAMSQLLVLAKRPEFTEEYSG